MSLLTFCHKQGMSVSSVLSTAERKSLGQFMTPPAIAQMMALRACEGIDGDTVRILEPAVGAGILAASAVETLLKRETPPRRIELTVCELDERLLPTLRNLAARLRKLATQRGSKLTVSIKAGDFLLSQIAKERRPQFDLIISNPPYFKLTRGSPQALVHAYAVHGQPNIYGLFMACCAQLLAPSGKWCFITPRSWTNGAYFAAVRRHMLTWLRIDSMHVFESREAHFIDDEVLQEAMITWATAQAAPAPNVLISTSYGTHDLAKAAIRAVPVAQVVCTDAEQMIMLPHADADNGLAGCTETLESLGLKVSTGPVVPFRSTEHIKQTSTPSTVPLLWMQHVSRMRVSWPIQKKREHIDANVKSAWMLCSNTPMVLMRRFSPKEGERRIIAAAYLGEYECSQIGLENHLNYIYRPGGELGHLEAIGLAAYLNSSRVEQFFRAIAGSTQVNATELRKLPMPSLADLVSIGWQCQFEMTICEIDRCVDSILGERAVTQDAA